MNKSGCKVVPPNKIQVPTQKKRYMKIQVPTNFLGRMSTYFRPNHALIVPPWK